MIKILQSTSTWRYMLPLFILFCGVTFYIFPKHQSQLYEIAGEEVKPLDDKNEAWIPVTFSRTYPFSGYRSGD